RRLTDHSLRLRVVRTPNNAFFLYRFSSFSNSFTTDIYTLSLHDALPISSPSARHARRSRCLRIPSPPRRRARHGGPVRWRLGYRSEEHTSELQSRFDLVCRLLLEKKKI